ncbi:MAG TPA: LacI family DNA-binding transcriptional regulator [Acidothermaceae bacterium]|nr:LacI family DNA-binding transcriptional regulator [Acidothermaceae bacterium]
MASSRPGVEPGRRPTVWAVAAAAGVSKTTVSRVLTGSPRVSAEARAAVEKAIEQLGYVPNRAARSLVTRRTDTIALIVSEPESRLFSEPFFAGTVRGISEELARTDYAFVLLSAEGDITRIERYIMNGHADGMILMSLHKQDPLLQLLTRTHTPVVLSGRPFAGDNVPYVDSDNRTGAARAVQHLVATGRKRITTITGPADMPVGVDRLEGFRDALPAGARKSWRRMVAHGDFSEESGERAMRELLERVPDLDAVFAASDLMAVGAMRALRASGRKVPDDVAVVGFDDSHAARLTDPQLTTVRQPMEEMGRSLARLLLTQLRNPGKRPASLIVPTELVVRDSS